MKKWGFFSILVLSAWFIGSQNTETAVGVQPSAEVRYPQEKDILNPVAVKKAEEASIPLLPETQPLQPGWYVQIIIPGDELKAVETAIIMAPSFTPLKLFLRPRNGEWRLLVGPLGDGILQNTLKIAQSHGLPAVLRRETGLK